MTVECRFWRSLVGQAAGRAGGPAGDAAGSKVLFSELLATTECRPR